jgi:hypothetical protein
VTTLPLQRLVCVAFNGPEEVLAVTSCEGGALMVRLPGPDAWAAAFSALQLAVGTSAQVGRRGRAGLNVCCGRVVCCGK